MLAAIYVVIGAAKSHPFSLEHGLRTGDPTLCVSPKFFGAYRLGRSLANSELGLLRKRDFSNPSPTANLVGRRKGVPFVKEKDVSSLALWNCGVHSTTWG